jgi:hypothetical protein
MYQGQTEFFNKSITTPAAGRPQTGEGREEKVRVWPELVLRETIATLAVMIPLFLFSIYVAAPLEEVADPSFSMNPSKAPWYFLGLQELLVYFSPWVAGVAIPLIIVFGLAAIPYLDVPSGPVRMWARYPWAGPLGVLFGAGVGLWLLLTVVGLYFRGANWGWQWLDGTPIPLEGGRVELAWLPALIVILYGAALLRSRLRRREEGAAASGRLRPLLVHFLILTGLIVLLKIVLHTILDFLP